MVRLERVADTHSHTGEGPLWHPDRQRLYWVDIPAGRLWWYDPEADEHGVAYDAPSGPIGGFTLERDGALLLFTHRTVERFDPETGATTVVLEVDARTRFNDVIADPEGRVFCGTMPGSEALGDLYRIDPDGRVTTVLEDLDIPNGMGFSRDGETFYVTESEARKIYAFDYDRETGDIAGQRTFCEIPPADGIPDGMTVDADDHVWSARWNGGRVVRHAPTGEPVAEIELPARKVSSVTFGDAEYETLYVTTALTDGDRSREGDGAGAAFRVTDLDTEGVREFRSRIA
ncbi:gluconolaconase [Halorubrum saccharovorum]|uniref:Gluconolaconase n=1 Tax=Halorubrum saccharovorum TaxID=2248 RepID=A0A0F8CLI4_9EURY|nr:MULTISPECIES: SMP-30/gluconolactonase/LRE family protein [Halorubrum]KKF39742.1 gluconolaconase [Halorubrum saccharovorum]